jgi:hypothetical protein
MSKPLYRSFLYAFLYVLLGTIAVLSLYPSTPLHGDWAYWALFLTFPVTVISFTVMYAESDATTIVLIVQVVMFLITWRIFYSTFPKRGPKPVSNRQSNQ